MRKEEVKGTQAEACVTRAVRKEEVKGIQAEACVTAEGWDCREWTKVAGSEPYKRQVRKMCLPGGCQWGRLRS